jgi:hypothetical protein
VRLNKSKTNQRKEQLIISELKALKFASANGKRRVLQLLRISPTRTFVQETGRHLKRSGALNLEQLIGLQSLEQSK